MSLEYAILGFLNYRPLSGYDLKKVFDNSVRHFWPADQSQIYRTLAKLAEQGHVEQEIVRGLDRPDRKEYRITPGRPGRAAHLATQSPPLTGYPHCRADPDILRRAVDRRAGPRAVRTLGRRGARCPRRLRPDTAARQGGRSDDGTPARAFFLAVDTRIRAGVCAHGSGVAGERDCAHQGWRTSSDACRTVRLNSCSGETRSFVGLMSPQNPRFQQNMSLDHLSGVET